MLVIYFLLIILLEGNKFDIIFPLYNKLKNLKFKIKFNIIKQKNHFHVMKIRLLPKKSVFNS